MDLIEAKGDGEQDPLLSFPEEDKFDQQLTFRSIVVGLIIGAFLCFSNMYFGLQTGKIRHERTFDQQKVSRPIGQPPDVSACVFVCVLLALRVLGSFLGKPEKRNQVG